MNNLSVAVLVAALAMIFAGCFMLIRSHNMIRLIIAIELAMKAVTLLFIFCGYLNGASALAQSLVVTVIVAEVVVAVIGAGLSITMYRRYGDLDLTRLGRTKRRNG